MINVIYYFLLNLILFVFHILKYEDADLPIKFSMNITAISYQYKTEKIRLSCGDSEDRTHDLLLAKQALSQLSYIPNVPRKYI